MILCKAQDKVQWNSLVDDVVKVCKNALIEKNDIHNQKRKHFDHNEGMRGSKCHYNFRNNTKLYYGSECHDGGSFSVPLEYVDVVGHNRSAVVVESDVIMI